MVIILSCNRRRRKKNDKIIAYCNGVQSVVFKAVNCLISTRGNNKYVKLKTNGNIKLILFVPYRICTLLFGFKTISTVHTKCKVC